MVSSNTSPLIDIFLARLAHEPAVLVRVASTQGSVPREAGTWMAVFADTLVGTIGGGHLEYEAIAKARAQLRGEGVQGNRRKRPPARNPRCALRWGRRWASAAAAWCIFVSRGSARMMCPRWRKAWPMNWPAGWCQWHCLAAAMWAMRWCRCWRRCHFGSPGSTAATRSSPTRYRNASCEYSGPVQAAVPGLAPQSRVLIMSFSHAEDLDVVAACLKRQREKADLPFIGLIGSKTKWAVFQHRLEARGFTPAELAQVTCPIGVPGISGKEPEVIAVAVAAQLLQTVNAA